MCRYLGEVHVGIANPVREVVSLSSSTGSLQLHSMQVLLTYARTISSFAVLFAPKQTRKSRIIQNPELMLKLLSAVGLSIKLDTQVYATAKPRS